MTVVPESQRLVAMQHLEDHAARHGQVHAEVARAYEVLGGQYAVLRRLADERAQMGKQEERP